MRRLLLLITLSFCLWLPSVAFAQQGTPDTQEQINDSQGSINDRAQYQIDLLNDEVDGNSNDIAVLSARQEDIRTNIVEIRGSVEKIQDSVNNIPLYIAVATFILGCFDFVFRRYVMNGKP